MHNELDIKKLHEMLIKGEITSDELVGESLEKSKEIEDKYNAFALILDDAKGSKVTDNLLSGIPYGRIIIQLKILNPVPLVIL